MAEQYLKKGSTVYIPRVRLQTRKWTDQNGREKYSTEIVLQRYRGEVRPCSAGRSGGEGGGSYGGGGSSYGGGGSSGGYGGGGGGGGRSSGGRDFEADLDDEIPF